MRHVVQSCLVKYDPQKNPNPGIWLSLSEAERVFEVQKYHTDAGIPPPKNATLHALFHVVVENQIALGDEFIARATLERLMDEGLDRHEAVHAIGSVVAGHAYKAVNEKDQIGDAAAVYKQKLKALSAADWLKQKA